MLIYSMGASIDGFLKDRTGSVDWSVPSDELFAFHQEQSAALGAHLLGRKLYETMQVWETDPQFRQTPADAAWADMWIALPKIVFSRTLTSVDGSNARLARGSLREEVAAVLADTDKDVAIGGADLGGQAIEQGLVDEIHIFRYPVLVGGGTPLLPPIQQTVRFELVETRTFVPSVVFERYRKA